MTVRAFEIPYIFSVDGIPRRGSKSRQGFFFEKVEVAIPELTADDAPIAAIFPEEFGGRTYIGENSMVELRYHDENLFVKVLTEYSGEYVDVTPEMIETFLREGLYAVDRAFRLDKVLPDQANTLQRGLFPGPDDHYNPIKPFDESYWSSFTSKDRAEKRQKAEALSSNLIIVDGQFWKQVPEPRYLASHRRDERDTYVSVSVSDPTDTKRFRSGTPYGLTSWDRMARDMLELYGIPLDERNRAEILIEEAFPYDDALEGFVSNIAEAIAHDGDMLKSFEVRSMLAWAAMRDAMRHATETGLEQSALDGLATAAEAYATCSNASQRARSFIEDGVRLLDDRSVPVPNLKVRDPIRNL